MKNVFTIILLLLTVVICARTPTTVAGEEKMWLGDWLEINEPVVKKYLLSLTENDKGTTLAGVALSDGQQLFKGHKFIGEVNGLGVEVHLYLFEVGSFNKAAAWIEGKGKELAIPECPQAYPAEFAHVISGDSYTWEFVQPNDGVVLLECANTVWLNNMK